MEKKLRIKRLVIAIIFLPITIIVLCFDSLLEVIVAFELIGDRSQRQGFFEYFWYQLKNKAFNIFYDWKIV